MYANITRKFRNVETCWVFFRQIVASEVYRFFRSFLCQRTIAISERFEFPLCVDLSLLNSRFS